MNCSFFGAKEQIALVALFKRAMTAIPSFTQSEKSDKGDSLFRFGHKKIEKQGERNKLEVFSSTPTLKKSESLFRLRSFALYLMSVGSKPLLLLFLKK